ncbi:THAP domain-containing protein 1, partial [Trachymyrmex cornetzi]
FRFPLNEPKVCAQWVAVVNRKKWIPTMSSKICEKHFDISDFYNTKKKKRLKPDAVPKHIIAPDRIYLIE